VPPELPDSFSVWKPVVQTAVYSAGGGALLGALVETIDSAHVGAVLGALFFGAVGLLAGARYGFLFGAVNRLKPGPVLGAIFGMLAGTLAGALAGAVAVAFVGTLLGCMIAEVVGRGMAALGWKPLRTWEWRVVGVAVGGMALAFWHDEQLALAGASTGMLAGTAAGILLILTLFASVALLSRYAE
jgi:hypothetical protein